MILADDLSGAADCGIACTKAGLDTIVLLSDSAGPSVADALAIDADTRSWPPSKAAAETARLVRAHSRPGQILFKKLDSTLRGHVAVELTAALQARRELHGPCVAIMAPAFPATGRTTMGGHQHLHGVKLEHCEVWQAEAMEGSAHIPTMLVRSGLRVESLHLDTIRDPQAFAGALSGAAASHDIIVCDAEQEADLARIAESSMALGRNTIWVGSAGLAHHLPHAAGLTRTKAAAPPPQVDRPVLTIVGSASGVSRRQLELLATHSGLQLIQVSPALLRAGERGWLTTRAALRSTLARSQDVAIMLNPDASPDLSQGLLLARALAELVAPYAYLAGALVMTGGETARAVLQALTIGTLRLTGEIEAGVPVSVTPTGLTIVTKAGAFGRPDTLLACQRALRPGVSREPD